jgi:hypothetical protein
MRCASRGNRLLAALFSHSPSDLERFASSKSISMVPILKSLRAWSALTALAIISAALGQDDVSPYAAGVAPDVINGAVDTGPIPASEGQVIHGLMLPDFTTDTNGTDDESFLNTDFYGIDRRAAEFCKSFFQFLDFTNEIAR